MHLGENFIKDQRLNSYSRYLWIIIYNIFIRPIPGKIFPQWYRAWLKIFGANISDSCIIYNSCRIDFPSNISIGKGSVIGINVNIFALGGIEIGDYSIISRESVLVSMSKDFKEKSNLDLKLKKITIGENSWIGMGVKILPGCMIQNNVIIGAFSVVYGQISSYSVYSGNPAKSIKK